uniref:Katanin p80 subunit C-terminal domain-containing protein n=1 Tax=Salmo trutta TaxID=8032 RepID=A0A674BD36_SALTR
MFKEQPCKTEGGCVVYCKWETHHLTIIRRKQRATGRTYDVVNKENEMACFPPTAPHANKTDKAGSKDNDYFTELSKDHKTMTEVLFGRNLRLNLALTLWRRNVGELIALLSYRIKDTCILADESESSSVSIGCCVDLFPLVKKVLTSPYEELLKHWWPELSTSRGTNAQSMDGEVLTEYIWHLMYVTFVPIFQAIDSYLFQLPCLQWWPMSSSSPDDFVSKFPL